MTVFKEEVETKRVIFNVRLDLAERLEKAKDDARLLGKRLDHEAAIDKALEKFLKKAERKIMEAKGHEIPSSASNTPTQPKNEEASAPNNDKPDLSTQGETNV